MLQHKYKSLKTIILSTSSNNPYSIYIEHTYFVTLLLNEYKLVYMCIEVPLPVHQPASSPDNFGRNPNILQAQ